MKVFFDGSHEGYRLKNDLSDGYPPFEHMERPERVAALMSALGRAGAELVEARCTEEPALLRTLHEPAYVDFLKQFCAGLEEGDEIIPGVLHERRYTNSVPLRQRLGSFTSEIGTPLTRQTFTAALAAFNLALKGAAVLLGEGRDLICLTRPPGHHAGRARFGGYCFFNNAAGAAALIAEKSGGIAAVLDIDYHIGDGTLEFAGEMTPYFSLHADPAASYPFRAYPASEHTNATLIGLAPGTDSATYLKTLAELVAQINRLSPAYVVISTGFDTLQGDYIQDAPLQLRTEDFADVGRLIRSLDAPKLYLLEGGYDEERLEECAFQFFSA